MQQFIHTNDEGTPVLSYDELDLSGRLNFEQHMHNWASEIEADLESEPDASNAEKAEAINTTADMVVKGAIAYLFDDEGAEVEVDPDTLQWMIDLVIVDLAERYSVEVA